MARLSRATVDAWYGGAQAVGQAKRGAAPSVAPGAVAQADQPAAPAAPPRPYSQARFYEPAQPGAPTTTAAGFEAARAALEPRSMADQSRFEPPPPPQSMMQTVSELPAGLARWVVDLMTPDPLERGRQMRQSYEARQGGR